MSMLLVASLICAIGIGLWYDKSQRHQTPLSRGCIATMVGSVVATSISQVLSGGLLTLGVLLFVIAQWKNLSHH